MGVSMGKKKIWEVSFGKGRGVRKVLVDTKKNATKLKKQMVSSGLFTASEFRIKETVITTGDGIGKFVKGIKKRVKKRRKT